MSGMSPHRVVGAPLICYDGTRYQSGESGALLPLYEKPIFLQNQWNANRKRLEISIHETPDVVTYIHT
jgi:hypothetical protein